VAVAPVTAHLTVSGPPRTVRIGPASGEPRDAHRQPATGPGARNSREPFRARTANSPAYNSLASVALRGERGDRYNGPPSLPSRGRRWHTHRPGERRSQKPGLHRTGRSDLDHPVFRPPPADGEGALGPAPAGTHSGAPRPDAIRSPRHRQQ
jgi:hypothetical protein